MKKLLFCIVIALMLWGGWNIMGQGSSRQSIVEKVGTTQVKTDITTLDNGLRLITSRTSFKKVVIGVYVGAGLINETDDLNGISHFLEHMAFKGTTTKTAKELAEQIENLGGYMNASTGREITTYYVEVLPEDWKTAVDFLADILQNSTFPEEELKKERQVILEELSRSKDSPSRVLSNHMMFHTYNNSNLKNPILGSAENINKFRAEDLKKYMNEWYTFDNMVISACGDIDHGEFVEYVKKRFKTFSKTHAKNDKPVEFISGRHDFTDKFDQAHILLVLKGFDDSCSVEEVLLHTIFDNILDGGMSSRLFQEIREKRGLAYSVSSMGNSGKNWGYFGIYLGVKKENIEEAIKVAKEVLHSMTVEISDEEFKKAKNIALFDLANTYDSCSSIASSNASDLMWRGTVLTYKDLKKKIQGITKNEVTDFARRYINDDFSITVLKPKE